MMPGLDAFGDLAQGPVLWLTLALACVGMIVWDWWRRSRG